MLAFRGFFARFEIDTNCAVLGGTGDAQVGSGIENLLTRLTGGNVDIHFRLGAIRWVGFGIQWGA
jgi:hypothetical protein